MSDPKVSEAVAKLYNTYPFPPEPILDEPPPGYNWRWNWQAAYSFCTGQKPPKNDIRILDAGCGSGVSTEYLVHLNPEASVVGIDLSEGTLAVAKERCKRSGATRVEFHHLSLFDADQLEGEFDLINSVGVLHHTADPIRGIQALAHKLAPSGLLHIFVYSELGRWEISLMQKAIALLQGDKRGDYVEGVKIGREIFKNLPKENCLRRREEERWSLENTQDACFADMYVHPQEIDYNVNTLFELIDASGLEFLGFSNPKVWDLDRLIGNSPELMERTKNLTERERYRLLEVLDPHAITHYEFFLARPPLPKQTWQDDAQLLAAIPEPSPCNYGWQESPSFFDYNYQLAKISDAEWNFLRACDGNQTHQKSVAQLLQSVDATLEDVRSLQKQQIILLQHL
ncbi:methyltransferase domain-containing protein [Pseudanabaena sp. FACHB-1998]|uniref:class I SAM-dependent methyltransferase n=1 Tax=Pseudanabaena sp. FACHB-1998 TaxID=2692858 RepID=UPI0016814047|nr:class I SAM-dependent methyltransferase [Pseudanabaena sp. FACHB-1998]MBD2177559.1 methyltransferase domain-containing protein [Pseudanabaena sp. FACHB-1998]